MNKVAILVSFMFFGLCAAQETNSPEICESEPVEQNQTMFGPITDLFKLDFTAEAYECRVDLCKEICEQRAYHVIDRCTRTGMCFQSCTYCAIYYLGVCMNACEERPCDGFWDYEGSSCLDMYAPGC